MRVRIIILSFYKSWIFHSCGVTCAKHCADFGRFSLGLALVSLQLTGSGRESGGGTSDAFDLQVDNSNRSKSTGVGSVVCFVWSCRVLHLCRSSVIRMRALLWALPMLLFPLCCSLVVAFSAMASALERLPKDILVHVQSFLWPENVCRLACTSYGMKRLAEVLFLF